MTSGVVLVALDIVFVYRLVMTTGELLRAAREKKGLSQRDVAKLTDRTQPTVHAWEADETLPPTGMLRRVARVYGVRIEQLIPAEQAA